MIKDKCLKWLRCLFKKTKITKVISWHGIPILDFKLKVKLFLLIYNDIMKL
jgi:hypothetical protein